MPTPSLLYPQRMLTALLLSSLAACGGGEPAALQQNTPKPAFPVAYPVIIPSAQPDQPRQAATFEASAPGAITNVVFENSGTADQSVLARPTRAARPCRLATYSRPVIWPAVTR